MSRLFLYALSFFTNAAILVFEVTGGRLLAPYLGTSVGVWAGLIAVVLGGMAIGYHFGGRFADTDASEKRIGMALFLSGLVGLSAWGVRDLVPTWILRSHMDPTIGALIAGTVIFMPTVILLASISPMLAKNLIKKLETSAKAVGELSAVGTVGSILGAISAGMILIPLFGVGTILLGVAIALLISSFFLFKKDLIKLAGIGAFFLIIAFGVNIIPTKADTLVADVSTAYNRIFVTHQTRTDNTLALSTSPGGIQCQMYIDALGNVDETRLVEPYHRAHDMVIETEFVSGPTRMLFLGGCVASFPRYLLTRYPNASADVVEIDPQMTAVAKKYFGFNPTSFPSLSFTYADARMFANEKHQPYDLVFMDAFGSSGRVPFQLVTKEMFEHLADLTTDDGILILNAHGSYEGEGALFPSVFIKTMRTVFPHADMYEYTGMPKENQNVVIVASKNRELPDLFTSPTYPGLTLTKVPSDNNVIIVTDDYAPVEGIFRSALRPAK